jgi:hypothetical protein
LPAFAVSNAGGFLVKTLLVVLASVFQLATMANAYAHGDDKPKHGGIMGRGDEEVSIELVMENSVVALYLEDHGNGTPIPTHSVKGWLRLAAPQRPAQEAKLIPAGENKLTASGLAPRPGDRLTVRVTLPNGDEVSSIFLFR